MRSNSPPLPTTRPVHQRSLVLVFVAGAIIGVLGGMIGLGGADFRLPLLIGLFGFAALPAIIMNKAMSLVVVVTAVPARLVAVPLAELSPYWFIVLNLLAGSLLGAWAGAHWATRLKSKTFYRVIAVLLVLIAVLLFVTHFFTVEPLNITVGLRTILGVAAGVVIGVVAALMGVAGGELLIPTIVLLYGTDIKIAGSLSRCIPAHHARRVRPLQSRQELRRPRREQTISRRHDAGFDQRNNHRRPAARRRPELDPHPTARPATPTVFNQSLETRLATRTSDSEYFPLS
ncbi:sulfite exporter TauE/SafE family protein [Arthrobacter sp. CAN_A1]|uniref:sulfite exporter TauE/SafE family protein n=1 Tax=Arthrobacter sp. CAN_A1 TaxID=2787717 RepID=UPI0018C9C933